VAVPDTLPEVLTIEEFERLEDPPGYRLELAGGTLVREPQPGLVHGMITMNALRALDAHCREQRSGMVFVEAGYVLDPRGLVRRPDVSLLLAAHLPAGDLPEGMSRRPPDLAIDVVSPGNTAADIEQRVGEYLTAGTTEVWVLYPRTRTVIVHRASGEALRLGEEDEIDGGGMLPGFRVSVRSFFSRE
jgi:Uma2 family endonuclease